MITVADATMKEEVKRNVAQQVAEVTLNVVKNATRIPRELKVVCE